MNLSEINVGQSVRTNTPGEPYHKRTGTVLDVTPEDHAGQVVVDLGDVQLLYWPEELIQDKP